MAGCRVLICGGYGVSTLGICAGGGAGSWGMAVLKMSADCLRAIFCFYPRCGMGLDGVEFYRSSVRSAAAHVTEYVGDRLGKFFWTGNSSFVLNTRYDAVLGM